jgi:hypothetical protein
VEKDEEGKEQCKEEEKIRKQGHYFYVTSMLGQKTITP